MAPSVEGNKIGSNREKGGGEVEKKEEQESFDGLVKRGAGEEIEGEGEKESGEERKSGRGEARFGGEEEDDGPGCVKVEGERGEKDERAASKGKKEPAQAWGEFKGGVGRTPVPSGEEKEKNGGGERIKAPED